MGALCLHSLGSSQAQIHSQSPIRPFQKAFSHPSPLGRHPHLHLINRVCASKPGSQKKTSSPTSTSQASASLAVNGVENKNVAAKQQREKWDGQICEEVPEWMLKLGLTRREALTVIQNSPTVRTLDTRIDIQESIEEFMRHGFTKENLKRMLKREALVLVRAERLDPLWDFFKSYEMTEEMFVRKVVQQPMILKYSVENVLKPGVQFFLDSGMTHVGIQKILTKRPTMLVLSVKDNLEPTVRYYENLGLTRADVMRMVSIFPAIVQYSVQSNTQRTVDVLKENGFSSRDVAMVFRKFPGVMSYSIESKVLPLIYFVREVGGSEVHVKNLLTTQPNIVGLSLNKQIKLKFWIASDVLKRPLDEIFGGCRYFTYSLEDRILFRLGFYLRHELQIQNRTLSYLFNLSEKLFEDAHGPVNVEEFREEWVLLTREQKLAAMQLISF